LKAPASAFLKALLGRLTAQAFPAVSLPPTSSA